MVYNVFEWETEISVGSGIEIILEKIVMWDGMGGKTKSWKKGRRKSMIQKEIKVKKVEMDGESM